jgi:hypothetical protein
MVQPPYNAHPGTAIHEVAAEMPPGTNLRLELVGTDFNDPDVRESMFIVVRLGEGETGEAKLSQAQLPLMRADGRMIVEEPFPGTPFAYLAQDFDFWAEEPVVLQTVQTRAEQMPKEVFYIPAFVLLGLVLVWQRSRQTVPAF